MTWLIGIDEAGYGPNLGPLVVAASAWKLNGHEGGELYELLAAAVTGRPDGRRLAIADSKALYQSRDSLALLERGVFAALELGSGTLPANTELRGEAPPWAGAEPLAPVDAAAADIERAASELRTACAAAEIGGPVLAARVIHPAEFNGLVDRHGVKSTALSQASLELLRSLLDRVGITAEDATSSARCVLDKHGGRNHYGALLQEHFPEHWLETHEESRPVSRYVWRRPAAPVSFEFRAKGEAFLPTALASMTAKYLRERAMRSFNQYWQVHVPNVAPTAGYPVDAKRFRADIAHEQTRLGIAERVLWRCK